MAWIALFIAGLLETAWAAGLKSLSGGFRLSLLIATVALMLASLGAYPIWTGIGSVGSVVVGITVFKQDIGIFGIAGVACLMIGIFLVSLETH